MLHGAQTVAVDMDEDVVKAFEAVDATAFLRPERRLTSGGTGSIPWVGFTRRSGCPGRAPTRLRSTRRRRGYEHPAQGIPVLRDFTLIDRVWAVPTQHKPPIRPERRYPRETE